MIFAQVSLWLVDMQARFDQYIPLLIRIRLRDTFRYRLVSVEAPIVDIFILTCGEDVNVAMHTIAAAAAQYHPSNRFKVFLLDDGLTAQVVVRTLPCTRMTVKVVVEVEIISTCCKAKCWDSRVRDRYTV